MDSLSPPGKRQKLEDREYHVTSFAPLLHPVRPPHTLILGETRPSPRMAGSPSLITDHHHLVIAGTMPSLTSHGAGQYYAHASNAFWWLAGAALGFRRGGAEQDRVWPDQFSSKPSRSILAVISDQEAGPILQYEDQVEALTAAGYGLWDVVRECEITNSDDNTVRNQRANDIRTLLEVSQPTINRIVFANGKSSAKLFLRMNKTWLKEGKFWARGSGASEVFSSYLGSEETQYPGVELVIPYSVSPACCSVSFQQKLKQWREIVFDN